MTAIDVLIPTRDRVETLAMTLAGVATQTHHDLHVVVADQSAVPVTASPTVRALLGVIQARGGAVEHHHRAPARGVAEQRNFLLSRAQEEAVLYLDDDVLMESWVVARLAETLAAEGCGFVGAFPAGPSYRDAVRPAQEVLEVWDGPVRPEVVDPGSPAWRRFNLHRAANVYHAARRLRPGEHLRYRVAWIGACVLYDRAKLEAVGGFGFWPRLPRWHSGEEVLVQNLLLRRWGGCGILPSGSWISEVPTTVLNPSGTVDGHALDLLPEMVARDGPEGDAADG
ncbi:MAG TPA: glycosyltransferase family A protein [Thermomicrobiaceae bacterium]|nr:glycosyltransferase family A protein [Thermomicrobiaceae bacterium]